MELWDAYDEHFHKIKGIILERGKPIPPNIYHLVVDILVIHTDGSILLMKRDLNKPTFPGYWEASCGGSVISREKPNVAAIRETFEETGITPISLKEYSREIIKERHNIYIEYVAVTNVDKTKVKLQESETIDYKWVNETEFASLTDKEYVKKDIHNHIHEILAAYI